MSRIGKLPISIVDGVEVTIAEGNYVTVKGPKGQLEKQLHPDMILEQENGQVKVICPDDSKNALWGLTRTLLNNMVVGVTQGYSKNLELVGVGYRASNQGNIIELSLGYTHNIFVQLPSEIKVETKSERNKNPLIILESCDKQLLGLVCAKIRSFRKPEPYKGKGVKFVGEEIRRKSGKSAGAK